MPFDKITPDRIRVYPLRKRKSKSVIERIAVRPDAEPPDPAGHGHLIQETAEHIVSAREHGAAVILAFGAHLVKNGLAPVVIRLVEEGWITHAATNGAGGIHDWEFAWLGRSEEDVRKNVASGTFGTWEETGRFINLAVKVGGARGMGYGESLGALINNEALHLPQREELATIVHEGITQNAALAAAKLDLLHTIKTFDLQPGQWRIPHKFKNYSIFGNAFRTSVPVTVHPGIGYDIIYNNPYANGAALGRGAHVDYQVMVKSVSKLSDGVFLSVGSAIMAPQVFEKALSAANNVLAKEKKRVHNHFILVNDLQPKTWDWSRGEPPKDSPDYYLRFLKTFYRMGGTVRYLPADNRLFLHNLYSLLKKKAPRPKGERDA